MTEYAYDVDENLDTTTYPSGLKMKLERDIATGEVRKVRTDDGTTTFAERVEWWPGGPARSFTFGNGQTYSQAVTLRYEPRTIRSGPLSLDAPTESNHGQRDATASRPAVIPSREDGSRLVVTQLHARAGRENRSPWCERAPRCSDSSRARILRPRTAGGP